MARYPAIYPPQRVVNVDGRVEASGVDDQVQVCIRSPGLPVVGYPRVPGPSFRSRWSCVILSPCRSPVSVHLPVAGSPWVPGPSFRFGWSSSTHRGSIISRIRSYHTYPTCYLSGQPRAGPKLVDSPGDSPPLVQDAVWLVW